MPRFYQIFHFKSLYPFIIISFIFFSTHIFSQQGLKAEYYDGTEFDRLVATEYVDKIDQSWYDVPPAEGMNPHECSIRWTGKLKPGKTGTYTFAAQVDDGIRVWIDDQLIIDQWDLNDVGIFEGTTDLFGFKEYDLKVEYFNGLFEGEVRLLWKKHKEELSWYEKVFGDGIKFTVVPAENFISPNKPKLVEEPPIQPKQKTKKVPIKKKTKIIQVEKKTVQKKPLQKIEVQPEKEQKPEISKPPVSAKEAIKYLPQNVQFEKGNTTILEASYEELDAFIIFLLKYPQLSVKIEGHTDVVGDAEMNLILSKDRARVITEYMVEKGVEKERITSEGLGGSRPLFVPRKGKYYPPNRRVVFIIKGV